MLRRKMLATLRTWRREHANECLLICGARQVGKSYIVEQFGKEYASFIEIDFVKNPELKGIFAGSLAPEDIYSRITLFIPGAQLLAGETLIFLDEVQECPDVRAALKYLAQDGRFDVIASGSLLGIRFRQLEHAPSLPVGYERQVLMHPLDFEEYLWASGYTDEAIDNLRSYAAALEPVPAELNDRMMLLFREYLAVGGMPAVVEAFLEQKDYGVAHREQVALHNLYLDDIARYAPPTERAKARACYLSLPKQLAKENTRFRYATVEPRGTARKFDGSIDWLVGSEMVLACRNVTSPEFPLAAYEGDRFRLYASDTGLLMAMYGFEMKAAVVANSLRGPMKGGLYENLIAGVFACKGVPLRYWMSSDSKHEIEFLIDGEASVVPVEVKAGRGATASLNAMLARDDVRIGYKLIDGNAGKDGKKITLPLWMAVFLPFGSCEAGR